MDRAARMSESRAYAALAFGALAIAVYVGNGHYTGAALALLLVAGALLALVARSLCRDGAATLRFDDETRKVTSPTILPAIGIAFLLLGAQPPGVYLGSLTWSVPYWALLTVALVAAFPFFEANAARERVRSRAFAVLVAVAFAAKIYMLFASPQPVIDVFAMLQGGADALLRGDNPYTALYPNPYAAGTFIDTYVYSPLTLLVTAPFRWLAGDVRVAWIVCEALTFVLLLRLGAHEGTATRERLVTRKLALLYLFHPRALFVLEQAWTEPLLITLTLGFLAMMRERRLLAAAVCLGLVFASKQYLWALAPLFLLLLWRASGGARRFVSALALTAGVSAAVTLPLALWDVDAFLRDVWTFHLESPLRDDALNLTALLSRALGVALPPWLSAFAALVAAALGIVIAVRGRAHAASASAAAAITLFAALLLQKHAFCNYYYLVGALILAAAITVEPRGDGSGTKWH
jgi:hypothetical protein